MRARGVRRLSLLAGAGAVAMLLASSTAADGSAPARCTRPAPTSAAGYQAMFDAKSDRGWSGGDQAATVQLPDGRLLWLFADTLQGRRTTDGGYAAGVRLVHNSFLLQDGGCLAAVNGRGGREVIPNAADGSYFWPQTAVLDGGRLVVLALRVQATGSGQLDFRVAGSVAAVFRLTRSAPELDRLVPLPAAGPSFGVAAVATGGQTYVYGTASRPRTLGKAVYVARVRQGQLVQPAAWRYWTGRRWSLRAADAVSVVAAAPRGWSTSFSVVAEPGGRFRYVTKENEFLGSDLVTGTAATPVGPFTRRVVAQIPSRAGELRYTPLGHPGARLADGRLLVSYSRNGTSMTDVLADADMYKPQFLELTPAPPARRPWPARATRPRG